MREDKKSTLTSHSIKSRIISSCLLVGTNWFVFEYLRGFHGDSPTLFTPRLGRELTRRGDSVSGALYLKHESNVHDKKCTQIM